MKNLFPMYKNNPNLVYLDSAATTLKPSVVLEEMNDYYTNYGVNIHRGMYSLAYLANEKYENARNVVANFINAKSKEIIFTKGVTLALNLLSYMLENLINEDDEIIVNPLEHSSSLLPWYRVRDKKKAVLKFIPLDENNKITVDNFKKVLSNKTKIVAITHLSNALGSITPIKEICKLAHKSNAIVIVDAAQSIAHIKVDVKDLDCDYLAFSAHKMFGPTGIGVLYGKENLLDNLSPVERGGNMVNDFDFNEAFFKKIPEIFEAGTPPIAEAIGLAKAIEFINDIGFEKIDNTIRVNHKYLFENLSKIPQIKLYSTLESKGIISFNIEKVHPHDVASFYDYNNICVRAGHHCVQLLSYKLKIMGSLRVSLHIYNDFADVKKFINVTKKIVDFYKEKV